jgi:hypothetical protein
MRDGRIEADEVKNVGRGLGRERRKFEVTSIG